MKEGRAARRTLDLEEVIWLTRHEPTRITAGNSRRRYNTNMIETLYKTSKPERDKSECYVLVLARRTGDGKGLYAFMEEHGEWDDRAQRFLYQVMSIEMEDELTHQRALAIYDDAKYRLAQRGFVHSFVTDHRPRGPQSTPLPVAQQATA